MNVDSTYQTDSRGPNDRRRSTRSNKIDHSTKIERRSTRSNKIDHSTAQVNDSNKSKKQSHEQSSKRKIGDSVEDGQQKSVSHMKGVSKQKNKWRAQLSAGDMTIYLGLYDTPEEASLAHQEALKNFPYQNSKKNAAIAFDQLPSTETEIQGRSRKRRKAQNVDDTSPIEGTDDVKVPVVSITSRHKNVRITIDDLVFGGKGLAMYNTPEFRNQARNYAHARNEDKFDVVYGMIRSVRAKGGRFLYQAPKDKNHMWFDMSDSDAYNMILFRFHRAKIPKQRDGVGSILKINEADVLCPGSNCKDSRDHLGNDTFLDLVRPLCSAYKLATLVDRLAMCNSIVRSVQNRNGRFLGQDDTTGLWYELDQSDAQSRCYFSLHRHGTAKL